MEVIKDFPLLFFYLLLLFHDSVRGINSLTEVTGLHQPGDVVFWIFLGVQQFSALTTQSHSLPATELSGEGMLWKSLPSPDLLRECLLPQSSFLFRVVFPGVFVPGAL